MSESDVRRLLQRDESWKADFDDGALARGQNYAAQGRTKTLSIHDRTIEAACLGSAGQRYTQKILLEPNAGRLRVLGRCSCPVGVNCKHCAATLFHLHASSMTMTPATGCPFPGAEPVGQGTGNARVCAGQSKPFTQRAGHLLPDQPEPGAMSAGGGERHTPERRHTEAEQDHLAAGNDLLHATLCNRSRCAAAAPDQRPEQQRRLAGNPPGGKRVPNSSSTHWQAVTCCSTSSRSR